MKNDRKSGSRGGTIGNDRGSTGSRRLLLLFAVLILCTGCGRQDRLVPLAPALPHPLESVPWGTLVDEEAISPSGSTPAAFSAWSTSDFCFGDNTGTIVRVQGDELREISIPDGKAVRALYCWPGEVVEAIDRLGAVWFRENGEWAQRQDLESEDCQGVCPDRSGGLWIYGNQGLLVHQSGDTWTDHALPDSLTMTDAWVAPDGVVWLVTNNFQLIRVEDGDWKIEPVPVEAQYFLSGSLMIAGRDDGRLAIGIGGWDDLLFYENGVWSGPEIDNVDYVLRDLYWQDDELYGVLNSIGILGRWNGESWIQVAELPEEIEQYDYCRSTPLEEARLIAFSGGAVVEATSSSAEMLSPPLGDIYGVAELDGELHVAYYRGTHLVRRTDHWQVQEPFGSGEGRLMYDGLVSAPPAGLVAVGNRNISLVQGNQQSISLVSDIRVGEVFRSGADEVLLLSSSDEIMRLDGIVLQQVGTLAESNPDDLCSDGSGGHYLLDDYRLGRVRDGREQTIQLMSGWQPAALLWDPERGLAVAGDTKVQLLDQDGFRDVTPWGVTILGLYHLDVLDLCLDENGGWLALSSDVDAVLRYDGESWSDTELSLTEVGIHSNWNLRIRPTGSGDYLIYNLDQVARLVPGSEVP